jgi:hypothetical protein
MPPDLHALSSVCVMTIVIAQTFVTKVDAQPFPLQNQNGQCAKMKRTRPQRKR